MEAAQSSGWAGGFIYGLAGYERAKSHNEHLNKNSFGGPGGTYDHKGNGGIFGAAAGYNWQINNIVLGAEIGIRSGIKIDDDNEYVIYRNTTKSSLEYLGTLKARLGYDAGGWMPYVTGGLAYGELKSNQTIHDGGPQTWDGKKSSAGYVVGAGVDVKITEQVFAGVEYNYTDLGKVTFSGHDSGNRYTEIGGHYKSHAVFAKIGLRF